MTARIPEEPTLFRPVIQAAWLDEEGPTRPALLVRSGPVLGHCHLFPISNGAICVGRDPAADFPLEDGSVSRRHAIFRIRTEGEEVHVTVEDLGSTNGTSLGNRRVDRPEELRDGDRLQLGDVRVQFRMLDPTEVRFQLAVAEEVRSGSLDPLTDTYSRRFLEKRLPELVSSHRRAGLVISVLMLDIDHFKQVNDRFGHRVGDAVLKGTASAMRESIRAADYLVRYGGEEFAAILPGADQERAADVAERVRAAVQAMDPRALGADQDQVTISIGVATYDLVESTGAWLDRADEALYRAKRGGRNRVVQSRGES